MTEKEKKAVREARNAYRREWNRKNPEKVRAAQEKYWLKKAAAMTRGGDRDAETQKN